MWLQSDEVSCLKTLINTIIATFTDIQEFTFGCLFSNKKIEVKFNQTDTLTNVVLQLFHQKYNSGAVMNIAVNYSGLVDESFGIISLFDDVEKIEKEERFQSAIDSIRDQLGFTSLLKTNALESASRNIARSKLIGGHSAGGLDGLK